jgi:hypothetical protein
MNKKVILSLFLIGLILVSSYAAIAIAEQPENSPTIYILKNEAVSQVNESRKFTIGPDSKLGEIP